MEIAKIAIKIVDETSNKKKYSTTISGNSKNANVLSKSKEKKIANFAKSFVLKINPSDLIIKTFTIKKIIIQNKTLNILAKELIFNTYEISNVKLMIINKKVIIFTLSEKAFSSLKN